MEQLGRDTRQRPITKMAAAAAPLIAKLYSCAFNYCCRVQFLLNCRLVSVCIVEMWSYGHTGYTKPFCTIWWQIVPETDKTDFVISESLRIQREWQTWNEERFGFMHSTERNCSFSFFLIRRPFSFDNPVWILVYGDRETPLLVFCSLLLYDMKPWKATWKKRPLVKMRLKGDPTQLH